MSKLNQNRSKLLLGCGSAALAIGLTMAPEKASAQAFQATETIINGSATRINTGSGTETIVVDSPTAVIEWTPDEDGSGNALDFLPNGNTATFENFEDFAVLNIILPAANGNVTVFDGTVISQLDLGSGTFAPGGTVAFYSPTGIFVGDNAIFDVGNLILTTLDTDLASFDAFATSGGTLVQGGTPTTASVIINPGAQITATEENSFFAVTAAEIQMFGTSNVNGSTAFIAGEAVNITVSNGLFDIDIPVGTTVSAPIQIDGNVGGPSSTGVAGDNHLIYAVAAAQTDPISLLFSGNLGFDPAASAGIVNGEIVLSANFNVPGNIDPDDLGYIDGRFELTETAGSIFADSFNASSSVIAIANDLVQIAAFAGPSGISGNLTMIGGNSAELTASSFQAFDITGNVIVKADDAGRVDTSFPPEEFDAQGGSAFIDAFDGGIMSISGDVLVSANAFAGVDTNGFLLGSATGGNATVAAGGGTLTIGGSVNVEAVASEIQTGNPIAGGNVFTGGTAQIFANQGGSVSIDGTTIVDANAFFATNVIARPSTASTANAGIVAIQTLDGSALTFGNGLFANAVATAGISDDVAKAGAANGGDVFINLGSTGTVDVIGSVVLRADAFGGDNLNGLGGDAAGGAARLFVPSGGSVDISGDFTASAIGVGGDGSGGGNALAGIAGANVVTGLINIDGNVTAEARAAGGNATVGFGGAGGAAVGGNSFVQANGSLIDPATITIGGNVLVRSDALGGTGGAGDGSLIAAGVGGSADAGFIGTTNQFDPNFGNGAFVLAGGDNGNITVGGITTAESSATGGDGGAGGAGQAGGDAGNGTGGTAQAGLALLGLDGSVGAGTTTFGNLTINALGRGGVGGQGGTTVDPDGNGGDATGGGAFLTSRAGEVNAANVVINVLGVSGTGDAAGLATGGQAVILGELGGKINANLISANAIGVGGSGINFGGGAQGGTASLDLADAEAVIATSLTLSADGNGGAGINDAGGEGIGGTASLVLQDALSILDVGVDLNLSALANGGNGITSAEGAQATGGTAEIRITAPGTIDVGRDVSVQAGANGGLNQGIGSGGDAVAGLAQTIVENGGDIFIVGNYDSGSVAQGGAGAIGGNGFGGISQFLVTEGDASTGLALNVNADGRGGGALGFGGRGGDGTGGQAEIAAVGTATGEATLDIGTDAGAFANGFGGIGGAGDGSTILAGRGGDGFGGDTDIPIAFDTAQVGFGGIYAGAENGALTVGGQAFASAFGQGGEGGVGGLDQAGGQGGDGFGGNAFAGVQLILNDPNLPFNGFAEFDFLSVDGRAFGGGGGFGGSTLDPMGNGGNATGNRAVILAQGGDLTAASALTISDASGGDGAVGGNAIGGERSGSVTRSGGTFTTGTFSAFANAFGGNGSSGDGGSATGGQAFMGFQDGTSVVNGLTRVEANGTGGESSGGNGGDGTGGIADLAVFTATQGDGTINGLAAISANGLGGSTDTVGGIGGNGTGGEAFIQSQAGGSVTITSTQVSAGGLGGDADNGTGGNGQGGFADIRSFDAGSMVTIADNTSFDAANFINSAIAQNGLLVANGVGGSTGGGTGIGGSGTGGEAIVAAQNGGTIALPADPGSDGNSTPQIRILSRGTGGDSRVDGGRGGLGTGGLGRIEVDNGTVSMGTTILSVLGFGGPGANAALDIDGGDAVGGDREVSVVNGGQLTAALVGGTAGGIAAPNSGNGDGGSATGGTVLLEVLDSTFNAVGTSFFGSGGTGSDGSVGGDAAGGEVTVTVNNSTINVVPDAGGSAVLAFGNTVIAGQGVSDGGDATGDTITATFTDSAITGSGQIFFSGDAVAGNATDGDGQGGNATGGDISLSLVNTDINISGGANSISANATGGSAGTTGGNAEGGLIDVFLDGANIFVAQDGSGESAFEFSSEATAGEGTDGQADAAGGTVALRGDGPSQFFTDALLLDVRADAGTTLNGDGGSASAGTARIILDGTAVVDTDELDVIASASSTDGGSTNGGRVEVSLGLNNPGDPLLDVTQMMIEVGADGGSNPANPVNAPGTFLLEALQGRIVADRLFANSIGDTIGSGENGNGLRAAGGDILIVDLLNLDTTGDIFVETGSGSIIGGPDPLSPTANLNIQSQGTVFFNGDDDDFIGFGGAILNLAANNIAINNGARLGAAQMNFISLNDDNPAIIGGSGTPSGAVPGEGFALIAEELGRLEVESFSFIQPTTTAVDPNAPDIIFRDALALGSLDDGVSNVFIAVAGTNGIIRVEGQIGLTDAASTDTFSLQAQQRIEVVTPGGIGLFDPDNNPTGNLFLSADDIWVADSDMIALLQGSTNFTGRNDDLSVAAAGSDDPLGYIRGGRVDLQVSNSLLVRNTGSADEPGGILVGSGGLTIADPNADSGNQSDLDVFAYGARIDTQGNLTTGEDFFNEVEFNEDNISASTLYSEESAFNDCLINTGVCDTGGTPPPAPGPTPNPDPDPDPDPGPDPEPEDPVEEEVEQQAAVVNNPAVVEAAVAALQPITATEQESDSEFGFDFPGLVQEPGSEEESDVEDPVAAGGDSSLYGQGNIGSVQVEGD